MVMGHDFSEHCTAFHPMYIATNQHNYPVIVDAIMTLLWMLFLADMLVLCLWLYIYLAAHNFMVTWLLTILISNQLNESTNLFL